jgi:hypothetical protein
MVARSLIDSGIKYEPGCSLMRDPAPSIYSFAVADHDKCWPDDILLTFGTNTEFIDNK